MLPLQNILRITDHRYKTQDMSIKSSPLQALADNSSTTEVLSLRFNGHFPREPGLAGVYWSKEWWRWSYKSCKAPVKSSPPTNQHPVCFTGRMPFLSPNQQWQSTEGKDITFHGLAYPKLTWGVFQLCLWPLIAPGYLGVGLPCLSSALWCQYPKCEQV